MKLRVAIAVESGSEAEALRKVVEEDPGREVTWLSPPAEAAARCAVLTPDILLLDLAAPGVDGVEATRRIMEASPTTILIVTSGTAADAGRVFAAMGSGARDVVEVPRHGRGGALEGAGPLRTKLALLARLAAPSQESGRIPLPSWVELAALPAPLVAVGASTGGPGAVAQLLSGLPPDLAAPVVVVQHVDDTFAAGLAAWLGGQAGRPVRLAMNGDRPREGDVLLAGTSAHLVVTENGSLAYTPEPRESPYRPSIDTFLSSAARFWNAPGVAVLLTGMGRDGAEGLLRCRNAGWFTVAQDERTSVLYGMPRAAREIGAAAAILPLPEIAPAVAQRVREERARRGAGRNR